MIFSKRCLVYKIKNNMIDYGWKSLKKYIYSFIKTAFFGISLGVITELALIYNLKWLINITQNEIFWVVIALIVAIFSNDYLSSEINTATSLVFMTISYYTVRLIKSGYTNIGGIYWYGIRAICVGLYVGIIVYIIKQKTKGKKIDNIPKCTFGFMTLFFIIGITIDTYCLFNSIFFMQPVFLIGILSIIGFVLGTVM